MKNKWDKILNELSYRVSTGIPDLTNEQHLIKLWDILKEHNWNIDARVELLKNLDEQDKPSVQSILNRSFKNAQSGRMIKVSSALGYKNKPTGQAAYGVAKGMMSDAGYGKEAEKISKQKGGEEKPTDDKGKEPETKEIRAIRTAIEKNKFDFDIEDTDEQIQDIAKKTTKSDYIPTDSKKASERTKEIKRQVYSHLAL